MALCGFGAKLEKNLRRHAVCIMYGIIHEGGQDIDSRRMQCLAGTHCGGTVEAPCYTGLCITNTDDLDEAAWYLRMPQMYFNSHRKPRKAMYIQSTSSEEGLLCGTPFQKHGALDGSLPFDVSHSGRDGLLICMLSFL